MGREGHQINIHTVDIDIDLASTLCSVRVEEYLPFTGNIANGLKVLDNTDLVIDMHDGNQNGVVTQ